MLKLIILVFFTLSFSSIASAGFPSFSVSGFANNCHISPDQRIAVATEDAVRQATIICQTLKSKELNVLFISAIGRCGGRANILFTCIQE